MGKLRLKPAIKGSTLSPIAKVINNIDRKPSAFLEGPYARTGTYANGIRNKPGQRIPKAGVYAEAGVGGVSAECSIFEVTARGPCVSAGAEASLQGVSAIAKAELVNLSASVGPIKAKVGVGVDTEVSAKFTAKGISAVARAEIVSVSASAGCIQAKAGIGIDTGISIGVSDFQVSLLGTGIRFSSLY